MELEIEGAITEIIFHSEESGYTVAVFETDREQFTVVGDMVGVSAGRRYQLTGRFIEHKKYGEQFAVSFAREVMPQTKEGMESFLSSGVLKGIGPKTAAAIVERFGDSTFEIIEKEPGRLTEIPGIGAKKAAAVSEALISHRNFAEITVFLGQFGIKAEMAMKLYKVYGADTIEIISSDPYQLTEDIFGIGFKKADALAEKLGIAKDDESRIASGIRYVLNRYATDGDTFAPQRELEEKTGELLGVSMEKIEDVLIAMAFETSVRIEELEGRNVVYPMYLYMAEQDVTKRLIALCDGNIKALPLDTMSLIHEAEARQGLKFSEEQTRVIRNCLVNGVSVITGGPGTGKTTIINGILNILENGGVKTALAAPTGRAAKRMSETTGHDASTVHRLLEYYFDRDTSTMRFGKTEEDPLDAEAVIVDEASMLDILLADGLLKAIKPGTRLILVGDADQLPSVGAGNVLKDLIESEYIHAEKLTKIFRQAAESYIVVNAHRINKGEEPYCNEQGGDFFFMSRNTEKDTLSLIKELCEKRLGKYYHLNDIIQDIQVLTPTRRGLLGTVNLNRELQKVLNPASPLLAEKEFGERIFRENDKVMQIKNNYELTWRRITDMSEGQGVFNGDIGMIDSIDNEDGYLTVVYDTDRYVRYPFDQLDELELAYAMTVHKSQGSEFPVVVMPMTWVSPMLASRNLLYTGVTRGKRAVVLVGSEKQMLTMIANNRIKERNSGLAIRIKNLVWNRT